MVFLFRKLGNTGLTFCLFQLVADEGIIQHSHTGTGKEKIHVKNREKKDVQTINFT